MADLLSLQKSFYLAIPDSAIKRVEISYVQLPFKANNLLNVWLSDCLPGRDMHRLMYCILKQSSYTFNTLRPRQNGRRYPEDIFKCIFLNENICILINISLKFVPKGQINNIPSLVQIMAWRRPGDKPLFEPMMVNLVTHICVTRPQ